MPDIKIEVATNGWDDLVKRSGAGNRLKTAHPIDPIFLLADGQ